MFAPFYKPLIILKEGCPLGVSKVLKTPEKRRKKNHAANLRLIVKMLKKHSPQGGVTLQQMAEACGVSERNIYRYLQELKQLGIEIERHKPSQPGKPGCCYYKIKMQQENEFASEILQLVFLSQALQDCYKLQKNILSVKQFVLCCLANRYGLNLPVTCLKNIYMGQAAD
ncbi:helix-turn-helix domain-containing protein [Desulforamulus putei]|uniref:HTH domain-containing protein n=1 Tax=Desulforamulus putei DSM 12395 TaxID=1121429 RepID=A0A1M4W9Z4_9FIRM|nr:helix-turn-helix domain-containing protein [Desulforamulus putei]SHE77782.1 HTH domain-containing protein [Desulforamulus putei DSM 12395]